MLNRPMLAAIVGGSLALSACATGPAHTVPPPPGAAVVTMGMTSFNPPQVRIRSGQTVQWRNTSMVPHTVTADPALAANPANVALPTGAAPFHSGNIPAGQVWAYRFTVPGYYRYVCLPHEGARMIGSVIVDP